MSFEYASDAIDVVSIAMVVIAIGIIWSRSIGVGLILLSVQSVLLALGGVHAGIATEEWHVVLGAALTFTAKAVVAPLLKSHTTFTPRWGRAGAQSSRS